MEMNLQLIMDVLASKDGSVGGPQRESSDSQSVPLYLTNPDITFADKHPLPRFSGQMPFVMSLNMMMQHIHGTPLEFVTYGKPAKATFDYAAEIVQEQA